MSWAFDTVTFMRGLGRPAALVAAVVGLALPAAASADDPQRPSAKKAWAAYTATPAARAAQSWLPGAPPPICEGDFWSDQIGTNVGDILLAARRAERLWGRSGPDILYGSTTRAACLLGGHDPDVLDLNTGGGASWGEHGSDLLVGSNLDDILDGGAGNDELHGAGGADAMFGGSGVDGIDAGPGDDKIAAADDRAEIVDCGPGLDTVIADTADVLVGCERGAVDGPELPTLIPIPAAAQLGGTVRVRFKVPEAAGPDAYRILMLPRRGCDRPLTTLSRFPRAPARVNRGRTVRIGLRPPAGGWCAGAVDIAVVIDRPCRSSRMCATPPPAEPIARLRFQAA